MSKEEKQQVRDEARAAVFERDGHRCVVPGCQVRGGEQLDPHHILSRKFMPDGGYALDNLVSLCKVQHHLEAEEGRLSVVDLRRMIGTFPEDWRHTFRKFPKVAKHPDFTDLEEDGFRNTVDWAHVNEHFQGELLVEEKLDGSNMGIGLNGDGTPYGQTRGQVVGAHTMNIISTSQGKNVKAFIEWLWRHLETISRLPPAWMVYGEWLRYCHTVPYTQLPAYFIAFAVHDGREFLKPLDARRFLEGVGFAVPPRVQVEDLQVKTLERATRRSAYSDEPAEGLVIKSCATGEIIKWVRPEFRTAMKRHGHWRKRALGENRLVAGATW